MRALPDVLHQSVHAAAIGLVILFWLVLLSQAGVRSQSAISPRVHHGAPLFTTFISGHLREARLLDALAPDARRVYLARLTLRQGYGPKLVAKLDADPDGKDGELLRPALEAAIVALSGRTESQADAVAFASGVPMHYEWEGSSVPILVETTWAEQFLTTRPRTAIAGYIHLFLLSRYRAAFEAAIDEGKQAEQEFAALRYRAEWSLTTRHRELLVRVLAEHVDQAEHAYIATGRHPRAR